MALSKAVTGHHNVWVHYGEHLLVQVRYAVTGDRLLCFGDHELASVPDGARVLATVHEIAGGPQLDGFGATLRDVAPADVDTNALVDVIGHVPLGRTMDEVNASIDRTKTERRIVELVP